MEVGELMPSQDYVTLQDLSQKLDRLEERAINIEGMLKIFIKNYELDMLKKDRDAAKEKYEIMENEYNYRKFIN